MDVSAPPRAGGLDRSRRNTIAAAIFTIALVGMGLSLTLPLLSLRMEAGGMSGGFIGMNTAFGGLATMLGAPFVPRLARRFGVRPVLFFAVALGATTLLSFHWIPNFDAWFALRFLFGVSLTILFVLSEYWINAAAPPERRGLVMGIYATVLSLGFAAGPAILAAVGTSGIAPFAVGAAIYLLAMIPIALAGGDTPAIEDETKKSVLSFLRAAPAATLAGFIYGAVETGAFGLLPVYGRRIGFEEQAAAALITVVALGNVMFQIPIGLLADRIDKRKVLMGCALVGTAGAAAIPFLTATPLALWTVLFVWGGIVAGLYTVGLSLLGARYTGAELATANATFVILYSLGMIAGPPVIGLGMDAADPHGFAWSLAGMFAIYVVVIGARFGKKD